MVLESAPAQARGLVRESVRVNGRNRTQYLFVPQAAASGEPAPLVVLLHAYADARTLAHSWQPLARRHGFILLAPNTLSSSGWTMRDDGPEALHALIERVRMAHPVDARRLYVFGIGGGATHALGFAVLQPRYFAAVATHGGLLRPEWLPFAARAPRRLPVAIWMATRDDEFPVRAVQHTRELLASRGFPVTLITVPGEPRSYDTYDLAHVWRFFDGHRLEADPVFARHPVP